MEKVKSTNHYRELVSGFKRENKYSVQNLYYMFSEVEKLIRDGKIFYEHSRERLLLYQEEGRFFRVSFLMARDFYESAVQQKKVLAWKPEFAGTRVGSGSEPEIEEETAESKARLRFQKNCVIVIPDNGMLQSEKAKEAAKGAEILGYQFSHCNRMYEIDIPASLEDLKKTYMELEGRFRQLGLKKRSCKNENIAGIKELWKKCLTDYNISDKDWETNIKESILVVDTKAGNTLCGVIMPRFDGNDNVGHLAVNSEYRRNKIGIFLYWNVLQALAETGMNKACVWVADDNGPAVDFHKRYFQMKECGLCSCQYVKNICFDKGGGRFEAENLVGNMVFYRHGKSWSFPQSLLSGIWPVELRLYLNLGYFRLICRIFRWEGQGVRI